MLTCHYNSGMSCGQFHVQGRSSRVSHWRMSCHPRGGEGWRKGEGGGQKEERKKGGEGGEGSICWVLGDWE